MSLWDVTDDAARDQWTWVPLVRVGPLHFGASHDEIGKTLGGEPPHLQTCRYYRWWSRAEFRNGVTAYYANDLLGIVAIHARYGPQVTYNDQALVGRVPSELEQWAIDQHLAHGNELRYSTSADPELYELASSFGSNAPATSCSPAP
jgi:hypothetical protein